MANIKRFNTIVRIAISRSIPGDAGVLKSVHSHHEEATIELEIDVDGLLRHLGTKAARNSTGRAREVGGLVVAKRIGKRRRVE